MLSEMLGSKKFWVTILGLVILTLAFILTDKIGLDLFIGLFSGLVGTYTVGQGIADAGRK